MDKKTKILLVDDHQMFLDGINTMLSRIETYEIAGESSTAKEALEILKERSVDLVVTDINMPEMSGIELTKHIKSQYPEVKVLILTMYNEREIVHEIIVSEAEGYILKNASKRELLKAIDQITSGGTFYSNEVMSIITENYIQKEKIEKKTRDLSKREREIIRMICQEYTTAGIAETLNISPLTVETHRKNILRKTHVKTIVGLIKFAIENRLT